MEGLEDIVTIPAPPVVIPPKNPISKLSVTCTSTPESAPAFQSV